MNETTETDGGLRVEDLTVRYGGNVAVDALSFHASLGHLTGLIGPNGAGKTTTFNACTGLVRSSQGSISFAGRDITDLPPHRRAQLGIGRTFQRMELYDSMSVRENIELGREASYAGSRPLAHIRAGKRELAETQRVAREAIALCRLEKLSEHSVAAVSTGQRRIVELARAIAGRNRLLLLDEPSSGLDHSETSQFGDILVALVEEQGVGILLVEHDMSLVMRVCEHIYVLDFGRLLFEGSPEHVRASDVVRRAYLGAEQ